MGGGGLGGGTLPVEAVVLSPHPDDAVFSAWDALTTHPRPLVMTVFAGVPEPGFVTPLDRQHGAEESAGWARRRRVEDLEAVTSAGCDLVHGDLLDVQYRAYAIPGLWREIERNPGQLLTLAHREPTIRVPPSLIDGEVGGRLGFQTIVYAPVGVGGHPDHADVARYSMWVAPRVRQVRLFADSPYWLRHGLPDWVTGRPNRAADEAVALAVSQLGIDPGRLSRRSVRLSDADVTAKLEAMRRYRTEFHPVDADFDGVASDVKMMRHETYWTLI